MLEKLREIGNNKFFKWIFAIFLIVPFGLFGIDFYFKTPVGGDTIATVGNQRIGAAEFDQALRQQGEMMRQQFRGNFDAALLDNPEVRRSVLDRLVNERLLLVGSERAGIRFSDKQLAERIRTEPQLLIDGAFSKERYEQIARSMNLSPLALDERLRQDFRQQQFRASIADTAFVPRATLDSFIRLSEQSREVSVVNLTPEAYVAQVKITPEQVKAYYDSHAKDFTTPERAKVEYVELSLDLLAAKEPVSAEDVKRAYEDEVKAGKHGQREERKASHILVSVKSDAKEADRKAALAKAEEIAARVRKNPAIFAEVAKKESQDPGSGAQGGDLGFFGRAAMVKPFEDAVFAAKKNDIVGPVASDFGYHVIRVTDIRPEKVKSLAEVSPEIEASLKKQAASRKMAESAEIFSNMVYEQPMSLKPVADALKLTIKQTDWIPKGSPAVPQLASPKIAGEIFSDDVIKNKRNTSAVETAPNVLVSARVIEHKPAELRPLEGVKAEIERRLQREEGMKLAKADGEAKLKDLQAGKEVAGVKWPAPLAVNRQKPGGLAQPVLDRSFRADAKKLPAYAGVESPAGYSLVKVSKVIELEKVEDAQREALGTQLRNAVVAEEMEATLGSLRERVGVKVKKDALEKKPTS